MRALVEFLAKNLVDDPASVEVTEAFDGDKLVLHLTVAPDDMGKVIGKGGRIVRAIRTVVKAAATKSGQYVDVEIG